MSRKWGLSMVIIWVLRNPWVMNEENMSRKKGDRHVVAMRKRRGVMEAQKEVWKKNRNNRHSTGIFEVSNLWISSQPTIRFFFSAVAPTLIREGTVGTAHNSSQTDMGCQPPKTWDYFARSTRNAWAARQIWVDLCTRWFMPHNYMQMQSSSKIWFHYVYSGRPLVVI